MMRVTAMQTAAAQERAHGLDVRGSVRVIGERHVSPRDQVDAARRGQHAVRCRQPVPCPSAHAPAAGSTLVAAEVYGHPAGRVRHDPLLSAVNRAAHRTRASTAGVRMAVRARTGVANAHGGANGRGAERTSAHQNERPRDAR